MKFPRKILFVASVVACLVLTACGSDEKCVGPNPAAAAAVPMYPSENYFPDGITLGPDATTWQLTCNGSMDSIEIPMSEDHIDINGTIATITQEEKDGDTTVTVQFEGAPLPRITVAVVQGTSRSAHDKLIYRETPTLWKSGMEKAFTFSSKDLLYKDFYNVVLCASP